MSGRAAGSEPDPVGPVVWRPFVPLAIAMGVAGAAGLLHQVSGRVALFPAFPLFVVAAALAARWSGRARWLLAAIPTGGGSLLIGPLVGALLGEPGSIGVLGSLLATSVRPPRAAVYPLRALLPVFVGLVAAFAVVLPSSGLAGSRVARDTAYAALGILAVGCVWLADRIAVSRAVAGLRRSRTVLHWIFLGAGIAIAGAVVGTTLGFGVGLAAYMAYALAARGAGAESLIVGENGIAVIGLMIYAGFFGTSSALAVLPLLRRDRDRRISGSESDGGATRRQEIP